MNYTQLDIIQKLNLELFPSGDNFVLKCPFCGDSRTNPRKKRGGLVYDKNLNRFYYHCFNCEISYTFKEFLKRLDKNLYLEYVKKIFREKESPIKLKPEIQTFFVPDDQRYLIKCSELSENHPAIRYLTSRLVPEESFKDLFFTNSYEALANAAFPGKYKYLKLKSGIVWKLEDSRGCFTGYQCRTINPFEKNLRFQKVSNSSETFFRKGLNPDVVLEGPIDALFFKNSVAVCNANLLKYDCDSIYFYDQEPFNKYILNQIKRAIKLGKTVTILPKQYIGVDVADLMTEKRFSQNELLEFVKKYSFSGLKAKLKLSEWL
jgi:hypothetical protein